MLSQLSLMVGSAFKKCFMVLALVLTFVNFPNCYYLFTAIIFLGIALPYFLELNKSLRIKVKDPYLFQI
jgi:hypothetical protein